MINKITEADLINKGVVGLPDVPGLTTIEMQNKFEEISRDVIIPRFNELIDNTVSASDEFSKLNTYNVGDYCIYQGVLYKCTTAITTAGEWDATKWKATSIDKELVALNSNLTDYVKVVAKSASVDNNNYLDIDFSDIKGYKVLGVIGIETNALPQVIRFAPYYNNCVRITFNTLVSTAIGIYVLMVKE